MFVGTVTNTGKVADGDGATVTQAAISGKNKVSDAKSLHGVVSDSLGITFSQNDISGGASVSNNLCEFVRKKYKMHSK